jgi:hypothetical protein
MWVRRKAARVMFGIGLSKLDELIATKQIVAKKTGPKTLLINVASLEAYVNGSPQATLKPYKRVRR